MEVISAKNISITFTIDLLSQPSIKCLDRQTVSNVFSITQPIRGCLNDIIMFIEYKSYSYTVQKINVARFVTAS